MNISKAFGHMYFGASKPQDDGSFISTTWLVLFFIPVFPVCSNRIVLEGEWDDMLSQGKRYRIISNEPLEKRITIKILAWVLVPLILLIRFAGSLSPEWMTAFIAAGIFFWIIIFPMVYEADVMKALD